MKKWILNYELYNTFSSPVTKHVFSLRCFPKEMASQKTETQSLEIFPCPDKSQGRDAFGNVLVTGRSEEGHDQFIVRMNAVIVTENIPESEPKKIWQLGMYRYATPLTRMDQGLMNLYETLARRKDESDWERAAAVMAAVYKNFSYAPGMTGVHTTAGEAWRMGCGVCQDYVHIFLALCRKEKMTVRYAAGVIPGEGQTHAWAEVYENGFWKGFDPTHHCEADESYICFATGRDAGDCSLNRGIFWGNASQQQEIHVRLKQLQQNSQTDAAQHHYVIS